MSAALGKLGFSVTTSDSGQEAMTNLASSEDDVILSDWNSWGRAAAIS